MNHDWLDSLTALVNEGEVDPDHEACCTLTAKLLLRHSGLKDLGHEWWKAANVWEATDPFSSVRAAAEVATQIHGRDSTYVILRYEDGLTFKRIMPYLTRGQWYFAQGWRPDGTGHAWIMRIARNVTWEADRVVESSKALGLRINETDWRPGDEFAPRVDLAPRLLHFQSGIGLAEL